MRLAFQRIEQNEVVSSWSDALSSGVMAPQLHGPHPDSAATACSRTARRCASPARPQQVLQNVWSIGGERGWYKVDWLWRIRGLLDKLAGGVGLRRGRRSPTDLRAGDPLDFWRVLVADRAGRRLLLYAEMKLPGEAWLQFQILPNDDGSHTLEQLAAFRPHGLAGRLYWYSLVPFHFIIFKGMIENIVQYGERVPLRRPAPAMPPTPAATAAPPTT